MKILSLEPTPSPNVMKLNMDESLPKGKTRNYTRENYENAPQYIQDLFSIEGVQGIFQVNDFLALERHPKADWRELLMGVEQILGAAPGQSIVSAESAETTFGEVHVIVQMTKEIPYQVKLMSSLEERRLGLSDRFGEAVLKVQEVSQHLLVEREWVEQGVRYGTFQEVGEEVVNELEAAYDQERLNQLVALARGEEGESRESYSAEKIQKLLEHPDWEKRFAALERIDPTVGDIPILKQALEDSNVSVRRLATVYLGMIEKPAALPPLFKALQDKSAAVRRTAGDALSDIGDPLAIAPMAVALKDRNKLVRWRAARFLFEVGDSSALPALREAEQDPEFEVSLQAKLAVERIERGEVASGTMWQQMTRSLSQSDEK